MKPVLISYKWFNFISVHPRNRRYFQMTVTISIFIDHYLENWLSIRLHYLKLTSFGHIRTFQPFIIEFQAICIQDHAK